MRQNEFESYTVKNGGLTKKGEPNWKQSGSPSCEVIDQLARSEPFGIAHILNWIKGLDC
jgi:hypothetical protein